MSKLIGCGVILAIIGIIVGIWTFTDVEVVIIKALQAVINWFVANFDNIIKFFQHIAYFILTQIEQLMKQLSSQVQ